MKTFKGYLNEATVGKPSGASTIHQDSAEDGVISAANIHDADVLKKVNAFVGAIADGEYLSPQAAIHGLREKLMRIGLQFGDVETPGKNGNATVEVVQFGGRFGKTGTEAPDEVTNDDGISHMVEGGLSLKLRYEMMPNNNSCKIFAKIE